MKKLGKDKKRFGACTKSLLVSGIFLTGVAKFPDSEANGLVMHEGEYNGLILNV